MKAYDYSEIGGVNAILPNEKWNVLVVSYHHSTKAIIKCISVFLVSTKSKKEWNLFDQELPPALCPYHL